MIKSRQIRGANVGREHIFMPSGPDEARCACGVIRLHVNGSIRYKVPPTRALWHVEPACKGPRLSSVDDYRGHRTSKRRT